MPEDPSTPTPDPSAYDPRGRPVGSAFAGETTRSMSEPPLAGDETVLTPGARFETVGDFEIISKLGQGGMGAVYRARQRSLDRQIALKILPPTLEADADFVTRFQREARLAASLNHANLVKVYASGEADGTHYIAMELIEGETLGDWLKRGVLPPIEALRICGDVARALAHGWQRAQLIHRDIKPGNIFLSIHGEVKVGDLGLAKSMGGDTTGLTQTGTAMGTPHYISPEQARGEKDLDFRADIYSLGCTLYQMLTGQTPYRGGDPMSVMLQHINSPPPAILKAWPQCPIPVARLVGKMLKKAKRERHASYEELLNNIESVRALYDPSSATPPPPPPDPDATILQGAPTPRVASATVAAPITKSRTPLYAAIAAGVVVLGIVAFLVWPKGEKLSKAELYAKQREAERAARGAAPDESSGGTLPHASDPSPVVGSEDQGPAGARPSEAAAEPWQDVLRNPAGLTLLGSARLIPDGIRFDGAGVAYGRPESRPVRDGAVRLRARFGDLRPKLRARGDDYGAYEFALSNANAAAFERWDSVSRKTTLLLSVPLPKPLSHGHDYEMELRVVGQTLTGRLNGIVVGTVTDAVLKEGNLAVVVAGGDGVAVIKSLEVLTLDAPAAAVGQAPRLPAFPAGGAPALQSSSGTATKDSPFINSLGMKFVPVPIVGGPTDGQRVLFSIWETRVQDYEVFVKETGREWPKPDFEQTPEHPVVMVSWDDARAFCAWLTQTDRKAGRLGVGEAYRLPSDHEWSCAAGIGSLENANAQPNEKNEKIPNVFPWGAQWPLPASGGNYRGNQDSFPNTAPAGSFTPNNFGLFDLGGNAWEWVQDRMSGKSGDVVMRGSSWQHEQQPHLLSSIRRSNPVNLGSIQNGFRVVLAPAP